MATGQAELALVTWLYTYRLDGIPVTHLSTNPARRRVTSIDAPNVTTNLNHQLGMHGCE